MTDFNLFEKIAELEKEIRETPYHKGTEHHIGQLKARLAKLKRKALSSRKKGRGLGFALKRGGDATVVLVGPPSVGKSTLLNKLTGAHARVEPWPFTTLTVIPGMMKYKGAQIQIFDLPGIIGGVTKGIGRGKEVLSVARIADLLLLMVDFKNKTKINSILDELKNSGINLPFLVVINKVDLPRTRVLVRGLLTKSPKVKNEDQIFISAQKEIGLDKLRKLIWQKLRLIRIYLKPKGGKPDFTMPLILKKRQTVREVIKKIFPPEKKISQILLWGPSARFPGQQVSLKHKLKDEDILSFSTKK